MTVFLWIVGILLFLLMLALSIGLHEAGHMVVAKKVGLSVPRFFVGFGPTLWSRKTSRTEYGLKAFPLGGFVMIEDDKVEDEKNPERQLLSYVSPWKRIAVFIAGPVINLIIGMVVLVSILLAYPVYQVSTTIEKVDACAANADGAVSCGARDRGVQAGDTVVSVNGVQTHTSEDILNNIKGHRTVDMVVDRGGRNVTLTGIPVSDNRIGIHLTIDEKHSTVPEAFGTIGRVMNANLVALSQMPSRVPGLVTNVFAGTKDKDVPSSVVAVGKEYGDVSSSRTDSTSDKAQTLLLYSGLLNVGLGLINLLPIMPLDGGRIFIALIDAIRMGFSRLTRRRWKYTPTSVAMINSMTVVAASVVFSFMSLVILSDISLIIRGQI